MGNLKEGREGRKEIKENNVGRPSLSIMSESVPDPRCGQARAFCPGMQALGIREWGRNNFLKCLLDRNNTGQDW